MDTYRRIKVLEDNPEKARMLYFPDTWKPAKVVAVQPTRTVYNLEKPFDIVHRLHYFYHENGKIINPPSTWGNSSNFKNRIIIEGRIKGHRNNCLFGWNADFPEGPVKIKLLMFSSSKKSGQHLIAAILKLSLTTTTLSLCSSVRAIWSCF